MPEFEPNWRGGFFRLWIALSACWIIFTAALAYASVFVPHQKDAADFNTCVANHAGQRSACSDGIDASAPPPPNPYVPYVVMGISGPLTALFAWFGVTWIREGFKPGPDDTEV